VLFKVDSYFSRWQNFAPLGVTQFLSAHSDCESACRRFKRHCRPLNSSSLVRYSTAPIAAPLWNIEPSHSH